MTIIKAANHQEAEKLIRAGTAKKIELAYDIGSDDFFQLASLWCDKGAKISKGKEHFIVSLKGFRIPLTIDAQPPIAAVSPPLPRKTALFDHAYLIRFR